MKTRNDCKEHVKKIDTASGRDLTDIKDFEGAGIEASGDEIDLRASLLSLS